MSKYYNDLHDRELLNQAESVLSELHRRRLVDVRVPCGSAGEEPALVRCPIDSVVRNGTVLSIVVDRSFEPVSQIWPGSKAGAASDVE